MAGRPAEPEVIWARPERAGRGPRPAYSRTDIAAAGVRIADADGLEAVSMRKVAAELGCGTMSLYNYVPRKEDLYELMVDAVSGEYVLPDAPSGDWRADVVALAHQTRALMRRHPWMPRLMSPVYGFSPHALAYLEYGLACLDPLGIRYGEKMELLAMLNGTITAYVANELSTAERVRSLPWSQEAEQAVRIAHLGREIGSGRYPRLAAAFGEGAGPIDLDAVFERMLSRILNGFAPG
ncbi:TetR/AcrR family transcriptional regulator [Streptomyces sp. NPDC050504]|uniref:TetR/AcrR family transcriptional regulator n=1 Tax=Streptomyces sp. NPDC050504 TaxID=3365618 RepID=UPI00379D4804